MNEIRVVGWQETKSISSSQMVPNAEAPVGLPVPASPSHTTVNARRTTESETQPNPVMLVTEETGFTHPAHITDKTDVNVLCADLETAKTSVQAIPHDARDKNYCKRDEDFWNRRKVAVVADWIHIWGWALASILSADYFSWNAGLTGGFGSFLLATVATAAGFMTLTWSLAEMCSALPFSGGSYGFARATMGKLIGMFVGLCESLEYMLTTAVNILIFVDVCKNLFRTDPAYNPLWAFGTYAVGLSIQIYGGSVMWNFTLALTLIELVVLAFYYFGCLQYTSFTAYAMEPSPETGVRGLFVAGMDQFMVILPLAVWWYVGIEALPLASEETKDSKKNVPKGWPLRFVFFSVSIDSYFFLFRLID